MQAVLVGTLRQRASGEIRSPSLREEAATPRLSIIIPTYNSAATIGRCLQSIGVQAFTDYEVIVQDGSPKDDTAREIEEFRKEHRDIYVSVFQEPDRGVYDAMNKGMTKARGEWLYFLGSDDELFDDRALAAVMTRENTANSNVLYGNVQSVGDSVWGKSGTIYDGPFDLAKLLGRNICHQAIFYRAEFAQQVGSYDLSYPLYADWDFNLRCWARTKFKYVDVTVAKFHMGGLSNAGGGDERFDQCFAGNAMRYFNLSLLGQVVNSSSFYGLGDIIRMQREKGKFHSLGGRAVRRMQRLRTRTGH